MALEPKVENLSQIAPPILAFGVVRRPVLCRLIACSLACALAIAIAPTARAVNCSTESALKQADRDALLAAANGIASDITGQNYDRLQATLLPTVSGDWDGIRGVAQAALPLTKGGAIYWGDGYLLDATDLKTPADTQFFCTTADSQITITVSLHNLPAGRYALLLGDYEGAPLRGQLALILGTDPTAGNQWKLGGLFTHEGAFEGHDGVWFWTHARALAAKKETWSAWFSYDAARWLLIPVDFLSSPNLEKLNKEQMDLGTSPINSLPFTVTGAGPDAGKTWQITALRLDPSLHTDDLALVYIGSGLTDPTAQRAEAVAVMSAFLRLHPELRDNFHGLWAYAERDGRRTYAIELAIADIPR